MYVVSLTTLKSAERHGKGRPYLARLVPGERGAVARLFVQPRKITDSRRELASAAKPGDIFEARRWLWDGERQQYYGGTVWFGVNAGGAICLLTRDEALFAIHQRFLAGEVASAPDWPERIIPPDIRIAADAERTI